MVYFVGAGSGAADLITVQGKNLLERADVIIYAGSLVNPELLDYKKEGCMVFNSATMTLEEVLEVMEKAEAAGKMTVRLHTGDPCIYGAIREQMDRLDEKGIAYASCSGCQCFLRCGFRIKSGIYTAGCFPECDHHPHGGTDTGSGTGEHCFFCGASGNDGCFSEHWIAGGTFRRADRRRLYGRNSGSDCIQGNLEGRRKIYLYGGNTGTDREGA